MAEVSDRLLDQKVTDEDVDKLASIMIQWESMRVGLGLSYAEQKEIEEIRRYGNQKREFLEVWRQKKSLGATYRVFIAAARGARMNALADKVTNMLALRERETAAEGILQ